MKEGMHRQLVICHELIKVVLILYTGVPKNQREKNKLNAQLGLFHFYNPLQAN